MANLFTPVEKEIRLDYYGEPYEAIKIAKNRPDYNKAWDIVKAGLRHKVPGTGNRLRLDSEGHNRHEERAMEEKWK